VLDLWQRIDEEFRIRVPGDLPSAMRDVVIASHCSGIDEHHRLRSPLDEPALSTAEIQKPRARGAAVSTGRRAPNQRVRFGVGLPPCPTSGA
jgi:hypothetical protein